MRWLNIIIIRTDILLIAHIFPCPFGARKNSAPLAKYPGVLYVKPSDKMYVFLVRDKRPQTVPHPVARAFNRGEELKLLKIILN